MHLGTITHPDPNIDSKVKHFYDHLRYLLSVNRDLVTFPIENHLTLLERIQFKLNSPILFPSSVKVIVKYLHSNPLFFANSDYFFSDEKNKLLISKLKNANKKIDMDDSFRNNLQKLVINLNGSKVFDGDKYFRSVLSELVECLGSVKSYSAEKLNIEYFSNLLLAEFLRVGFHWDDFTNVNGVMGRILSNKIQINDGMENNFYSVFPLPLEIENHRGKDDFKKRVEDFLKNRTFTQQFEGLYNFYSESKEGLFLFRIYNVFEHNKDFIFEHDGVKIFHRNQLEINQETWDKDYIKKFDKFVEKENTLLGTISFKYKSHRYALQRAIFKMREAIDFLNYVSKDKNKNFNGAILGTRQIYTVFEKGKYIKGLWQADKAKTRNSKIENTINYLYPKGFNELELKIQKIIRLNDKMLFRAKTTNYWDEKVNNYWRYLDGVFGYGLEKINGGDIIKKASKLILLSEEGFKKDILEFTIVNAISNSSSKTIKLNITPMHLTSMMNQFIDDKIPFEDFKGLSDYPFINEKFAEYENFNVDYFAVNNFYKTLLWENYEQRNFAFHQNNFCFSTVEKLVKYLPKTVSRIREVIIDELISDKTLSIQDAINNLNKKGTLLFESSYISN